MTADSECVWSLTGLISSLQMSSGTEMFTRPKCAAESSNHRKLKTTRMMRLQANQAPVYIRLSKQRWHQRLFLNDWTEKLTGLALHENHFERDRFWQHREGYAPIVHGGQSFRWAGLLQFSESSGQSCPRTPQVAWSSEGSGHKVPQQTVSRDFSSSLAWTGHQHRNAFNAFDGFSQDSPERKDPHLQISLAEHLSLREDSNVNWNLWWQMRQRKGLVSWVFQVLEALLLQKLAISCENAIQLDALFFDIEGVARDKLKITLQ